VTPSRSPIALGLAVLLAVSGCRKESQPSSVYTQARSKLTALLEAKGEEGYLDPRTDEVLALLGQVPADSSDAESAASLRQRIETERARLRQQRAEVESALAFAREAPSVPAGAREEEPEAEEAPEAVDAGSPHPGIGTTVAELSGRFSPCFEQGEAMYFAEKGGPRDTWQLKDLGTCREQHRGFETTLLLVEDGKVFAYGKRGPRVLLMEDGGVEPAPGSPAAP
jgi:hypothetical protein